MPLAPAVASIAAPTASTVGQLAPADLQRRLQRDGLRLRTGPFVAVIRSPMPLVREAIALLYAAHPLADDEAFGDFHVRIHPPAGLRRWWHPQVLFDLDGEEPFAPLAADQAYPILEWGLNWCVSNHCLQYVTIHAAVLERGGRALILPAPPGSGKSTLCAALSHRGWRLLSDELTLIRPSDGALVPLPRPVSLKNASIGVIQSFEPAAVFSPPVHDTTKGTVAHMRPSADSVQCADVVARPGWIVLPRYEAGAPTTLTPLPKAQALIEMADNSFNYSAHGRRGFDVLARLVDEAACHRFRYSDLDEAVALFTRMADAA